jgi:hypothetical protein
MSFIDGSVVNVALPAMQRTFATSFATLQWVFNGYLLALASLILLGGAAGDRFGRRRIFIVGLGVFVAASVACGLTTTSQSLIVARFVQGVGLPCSLRRASPSSAPPIAARGAAQRSARGPRRRRYDRTRAATRWVARRHDRLAFDFFPESAHRVAALLFALRLPPDRSSNQSTPLDFSGACWQRWRSAGDIWLHCARGAQADARCRCPGLRGTAPGCSFSATARAGALMPLSLFGNPSFSGANALTVLLYAALGGAFFLLPLVPDQGHGYSATAAGAACCPSRRSSDSARVGRVV